MKALKEWSGQQVGGRLDAALQAPHGSGARAQDAQSWSGAEMEMPTCCLQICKYNTRQFLCGLSLHSNPMLVPG